MVDQILDPARQMSASDTEHRPHSDSSMSAPSSPIKNRSDTLNAGKASDQTAEPAQSQQSGETFQELLTVRFPRIQAKLNAQASTILAREAGLTLIQWRILFLLDRLGPTTATQLNEVSAIDPGLLSRKIKAMADNGLLEVKPSQQDHRRKHLQITAEGRSLYEKALPAMRQRQQRMRSFLPPEDMQRFYNYLDQLSVLAEEEM